MPDARGPVERVVAHDQWVVAGSVGLIVLLAGVYTVQGVGMKMSALEMTRMARPIGEPMSMGARPVWTLHYYVLIFLMWWIMMVAMMTPSAAPMLLLYAAVKRRGADAGRAAGLSLVFLTGYLLVWAGFSAAAAGLQWAAEQADLASGRMMALNSKAGAGIVLLAAGAYQLSSIKTACLRHCQSPAHFLARHRHDGALGALRTGAVHGAYCLGCCWALMALLFVGGIMNLYWIVGLALYVLAEKLVPYPRAFTRLTGAVLLAAGAWFLLGGLIT